LYSETEKHIKTDGHAARAINRQWSAGWLVQMSGAGRVKGKHGYILNMDRFVSLMDTEIGWSKTEEQMKRMDGVGTGGYAYVSNLVACSNVRPGVHWEKSKR
jgi:hypothetical protein